MDNVALANQIAAQVVKDTSFWVACVGLLGAIVGSLLTILGNWLLHMWQRKEQANLDDARKALLRIMLDEHDWRKLSTLSRVVGCESETTRRLLIELRARGSEVARADEEEMWGLISKHPLERVA